MFLGQQDWTRYSGHCFSHLKQNCDTRGKTCVTCYYMGRESTFRVLVKFAPSLSVFFLPRGWKPLQLAYCRVLVCPPIRWTVRSTFQCHFFAFGGLKGPLQYVYCRVLVCPIRWTVNITFQWRLFRNFYYLFEVESLYKTNCRVLVCLTQDGQPACLGPSYW